MFILSSLLSWWYGQGWVQFVGRVKKVLGRIADFFSITQLLGSLFAPFRQIGNERVGGPLKIKMQAWADKQFSRLMGFVFRTILILVGIVVMFFALLGALVILMLWPVLPIIPIVVLGYVLGAGR